LYVIVACGSGAVSEINTVESNFATCEVQNCEPLDLLAVARHRIDRSAIQPKVA